MARRPPKTPANMQVLRRAPGADRRVFDAVANVEALKVDRDVGDGAGHE